MDANRPPPSSARRRLARVLAAALLAGSSLLATAAPSLAADPSLEAQPLLGGHIRSGSWTAVAVTVNNDGPAVKGELRLASADRRGSTYGTEVDLPTLSRKGYVLYGRPSSFRTKIEVVLVSGGRTIASTTAQVTGHEPNTPMVGVLSERPQGIVADVTAAVAAPNRPTPAVLTLRPADLPARVEAWAALDQLIWQDVDVAELSAEQLAALEGWVAAGGTLVVVGGTTGAASLAGFPHGFLPYRPTATVDAAPADLAPVLGARPQGRSSLPALAGALERGSVLARSGGQVVAAEGSYGQGSVTLVGFDPSHHEIAGSRTARALWQRVLPSETAPAIGPFGLSEDGPILSALNSLPSANLPGIDQLFLLLAGYIVLVGPLNYLVLRRLDRREWAWLTIPLLVLVFAVASYSVGRLLKGDEIIVNQLSIVRASAGTDRALGQSYIGVFSPSRQRFDVRVGGGALVSNPTSQQGGFEQPLDVLVGETSRLRGYQVGYGALRGFRADAAVRSPLVDASFRFSGGRVEGDVTNRSDVTLEAPAVVFGSDVQVLPALAPGATTHVVLTSDGNSTFGMPLPERLFGEFSPDPGDTRSDEHRIRMARRAILEQLSLSGKFGPMFGPGGPMPEGVARGADLGGNGPLLLAWRPEGIVPVELHGQQARKLGQALYLVQLPLEMEGGRAVFGTELIRRSIVGSTGAEALDHGQALSLARGTMTVEFRPIAVRGAFSVSSLTLGLVHPDARPAGATPGGALEPLPPGRQPDQDDPQRSSQTQPGPPETLPAVQLFDRATDRWVEFPPFAGGKTYTIKDPGRYVDGSGAFQARFVTRSEHSIFQPLVTLEGTVR